MGSRPMLDMKILREHPELVRENLEKRGDVARVPILEDAIRWDAEWREAQQELHPLRHGRDGVTARIPGGKAAGPGAGGDIREAPGTPRRIKTRPGRARRPPGGPRRA